MATMLIAEMALYYQENGTSIFEQMDSVDTDSVKRSFSRLFLFRRHMGEAAQNIPLVSQSAVDGKFQAFMAGLPVFRLERFHIAVFVDADQVVQVLIRGTFLEGLTLAIRN